MKRTGISLICPHEILNISLFLLWTYQKAARKPKEQKKVLNFNLNYLNKI